ncbi:META domain-containing protein [Pontiella sp.]|uniref:META domain-containing protein n=1 Tax=Pontiella sp. TaxID=2837462 RepID=UPI00356A8A47
MSRQTVRGLWGLGIVLLCASCTTTEPGGGHAEQPVEAAASMPEGPAPALFSTVWDMTEYLSADGALQPRLEGSMVHLEISLGGASGSAGANKFFGSVTLDGSKIRISATGSTMMMGTPELMAQENRFLQHVQDARMYQIVGEELRLLDGEGRVLLKFKPRVEPALTSNVWNAVGVNNGKGGVASILPGTEITIQFRDDGHVVGSSGCNSFMGTYETEGGSIAFGPLAGTRKTCAVPQGIMEQESAFLQSLENSSHWNIRDDALELRDASGSLQAKFTIGEPRL